MTTEKPDGWVCINNKGQRRIFFGDGYSIEAIEKRLIRYLSGNGFVNDEVGERCLKKEDWRIRPIKLVFLDEDSNEKKTKTKRND